MAVIVIDYGSLSAMSSAASCLSKAADSYANSLTKKVLTRIDDISGGSSDLVSDARYYLKKKVSSLEKKREQFSTLSKQITEFSEKAKRIDGEVEKMLARNQESFLKKNEHLRVSEWKAALLNFLVDMKNKFPVLEMIGNAIRNVMTELSSLCDSIKYWFHCEGGREFFQLALAIGEVILAIAIFVVSLSASGFWAICSAIGATIGLINSSANIASSILALCTARNGDPAWARICGDMNKFSDVLRSTNFNNGFLNRLSNIGATLLDNVELFCDIIGIVEAGTKIVKAFKDGTFKRLFERFKNFRTFFKEVKWRGTLEWDIYGKPIGPKMEMVLKENGTVATRYTFDSIKRGLKWLFTNKQVDCFSTNGLKDIYSSNLKDLYRVLGREGMKVWKDYFAAIESALNRNYSSATDSFTKGLFNGLPIISQINEGRIVISDIIELFS